MSEWHRANIDDLFRKTAKESERMTLIRTVVFAVALSLTWPVAALSQQAAEDLVGTWVITEVFGRTWDGEPLSTDTIASIELEIVDFDGVTFGGIYRWQLSSDSLNLDDGQGVATSAEETVLGVRDFDGTFIMVDALDDSIFRLWFTNETTMEVVAYEAGPHAVVSRMVFERQ